MRDANLVKRSSWMDVLRMSVIRCWKRATLDFRLRAMLKLPRMTSSTSLKPTYPTGWWRNSLKCNGFFWTNFLGVADEQWTWPTCDQPWSVHSQLEEDWEIFCGWIPKVYGPTILRCVVWKLKTKTLISALHYTKYFRQLTFLQSNACIWDTFEKITLKVFRSILDKVNDRISVLLAR